MIVQYLYTLLCSHHPKSSYLVLLYIWPPYHFALLLIPFPSGNHHAVFVSMSFILKVCFVLFSVDKPDDDIVCHQLSIGSEAPGGGGGIAPMTERLDRRRDVLCSYSQGESLQGSGQSWQRGNGMKEAFWWLLCSEVYCPGQGSPTVSSVCVLGEEWGEQWERRSEHWPVLLLLRGRGARGEAGGRLFDGI